MSGVGAPTSLRTTATPPKTSISPAQGRSIACALRVGDQDADILRHDLASGESVYVSSHHAWTMSAPRTVPATENHMRSPSCSTTWRKAS